MKENLEMKYSEIAILLLRDERTIWTSYNKTKKKLGVMFVVGGAALTIPLSEFKGGKLTILERVIIYLRDKKRMKYSEIAEIINRDQRNVWAIYSRASSKLG